jgi:hypothetical protein
MAVADNADLYANPRLNQFFPGVVPSLDGQCVSLVKWFMAEMSSVPNPQAARGDARYVGKTLVAQGHAVEVPYDQRRRGDLITYEYGLYGHIGVVLSGDRTFEQNVNWAGVASKIVDGARVYASRIGNLNESWRHDQHIYRLNTYKEGDMADKINEDTSRILQHGLIARNGLRGRAYSLDGSTGPAWVGADLTNQLIQDIFLSPEGRDWRDSDSPSSVNDINRKLDRLPVAEAQLSNSVIQVDQLTKETQAKDKVIDAQQKQIELLKAQVGDNSKWETFKALLRELLGIATPKS